MYVAVANVLLAVLTLAAHHFYTNLLGMTASDLTASKGQLTYLHFGLFEGTVYSESENGERLQTITHPNYPLYVIGVTILFNAWMAVRAWKRKKA